MHKILAIISLSIAMSCSAQPSATLVRVADGFSSTSVNNAVFRNSPLATHGDQQFVAFYNPEGRLTLGSRNINDTIWSVSPTQYIGNVNDAHNVISMGIDGDGFVHVAFDHHGSPLHYAKSKMPLSLELGDMIPMTGEDELDVTYPEFYNLPDGDLLGVYRSGASGRGNLVMKRYDTDSAKWSLIHDKLIDGENQRNAYWQLCVGADGVIHLSWVWRETWMVETNHDLCYAKSVDGGITWMKSDGTPQELPITAANAEYAYHIPQNSELINQTSMTTDILGNPYIATYWRDKDSEIPQYRLVWNDGKEWHQSVIFNRQTPFSLAGGGTKMIPIARPRLVTDGKKAYYLFRDQERGSKVSLAVTDDLSSGEWKVMDITDFSVDAWEPTLDLSRWQRDGKLDVFVQRASQGDGEKRVDTPPTPVYVLEIR